MEISTDLVIIGAGAAGLFAACCAARSGLKPLLLERRHRSGLKLLISGNNRCNFSRNLPVSEMIAAYGDKQSEFLTPSLTAMTTTRLREFFRMLGLESTLSGDRVYPESGKADDVLHALLDCLRDNETPLMYNCAAEHIQQDSANNSWIIKTRSMTIRSSKVLLTVGGFSFPKTGSLGDGQRFSQDIGIAFTPAQPGLVASEIARGTPWEHAGDDHPIEFSDVILSTNGGAPSRGNMVLDRALLRGSAIYDLNRTIAHQSKNPSAAYPLFCDFFPTISEKSLAEKLERFLPRAATLPQLLNALGLIPSLAQAVAPLLHSSPTAALLKHLPIGNVTRRSIKEAITTAGGLALHEFNPQTMEANRFPGLYAAGETLDYDGPTGGFNLHAAFATAALAIANISGREPDRATSREPKEANSAKTYHRTQNDRKDARPMNTSHNGAKGNKSAWGKDFWKGTRIAREQ